MKFSTTTILAVLSLSTVVSAAPINKKRQITAIDTINSAVSNLQATIPSDEAAIASAVQEASSDVSATAAVTAAINANLQDIANAFLTATNAIKSVTTNAVGGVAGAAAGFTQQEVNELTNDIETAKNIIDSFSVTLSLFATDLTPAVRQAISSEAQNVVNAIGPFVTPLQQLAAAVAASQIGVGGQVNGLQGALVALSNLVDELLATLL